PPTPNTPLSLHDALPIYAGVGTRRPRGAYPAQNRHPRFVTPRTGPCPAAKVLAGRTRIPHGSSPPGRIAGCVGGERGDPERGGPDRKSTRLNSSHQIISY